MNVKMWHNETTYNIRVNGVFYYWCDERGDKWRKRFSQSLAAHEMGRAIEENRIEWVKLTNTAGLPDSTNC